jgi:diguanylate cyclase (GGDEF)-like protein
MGALRRLLLGGNSLAMMCPFHLRIAVRFLAVVALAGTSVLAYALDPAKAITQYVQSSWNSEDGLPQNSVHAIAQTADGFLWLGTEEGLARFDGVRFTVFTSHGSHGLASDYIQSLASDRDGSLWIGTDSGLSHWIPGRGSSVLNGGFQVLTTRDGLAGDSVTALALDAAGTLWVGTNQGLNCVRSGRLATLPPAERLTGMAVSTLAAQSDGAVWIGTQKGLFREAQGKLQQWDRGNGLPDTMVTALAAAPGGDIWVGTMGGGLAVVHNGRVSIPPVRLPWKEVNGLLWDRDGALWIAFDRHGMGRLYQGRLSLYDASRGLPSDRSTRALFQDHEGNLWLGLLDAGMVQLRDGKFAVFGKPEGLAGNYTGNAMQSRDGSVWIGSDSNGLNRLLPDGRVEVWDRRKGLPDSAVYSILQTRDGSLWIGYRSGVLARVRQGGVSVYKDPAAKDMSLNALFEDRDGNVWAGFYGEGLARVEDGRFEHVSSTGRIPGITQTPDGAIWIADDGGGVGRWFRGSWTHYTTDNGLPSNHAMCIDADENGDVWVGTASGGLSRIRNGQITTWTVDQGLPGTTVGSIVEDRQGDLWLGGDSGIARVSKAELNDGARMLHPALFTVVDGLRSRETVYGGMPSSWKGNDGRLWFATIRGAAVTDPARIRPNPVAPPVWIENVTFEGRSIEGAGRLELGTGAGNLHVSYTATSFVAPARMQFRYRLAGFDRDWVAAGARREAWYTNLPPGKYTFHVEAANSDGVWNETGASVELVLRPPLSRTALAYAAYVLAACGLVWLIVVLRTRRLVRNREELNRIVAERTAQLEAEKSALEQVRRELHTRATHDSLTGLYNRAAILDHLNRELARAAREEIPLGVVIADLDHFKKVNDTHGHLAGDVVIRESAGRMRRAMRAYDLVGRYGGEEFLILLPGWEPATAPARVNELLEAIRSTPFEVGRNRIQMTCSFGIATYRPGASPATANELLSLADAALYVAKNNGRNGASVAGSKGQVAWVGG